MLKEPKQKIFVVLTRENKKTLQFAMHLKNFSNLITKKSLHTMKRYRPSYLLQDDWKVNTNNKHTLGLKKSLFVVVLSILKRDFLSLNKYSGG